MYRHFPVNTKKYFDMLGEINVSRLISAIIVLMELLKTSEDKFQLTEIETERISAAENAIY
jgi:hypothetical protein